VLFCVGQRRSRGRYVGLATLRLEKPNKNLRGKLHWTRIPSGGVVTLVHAHATRNLNKDRALLMCLQDRFQSITCTLTVYKPQYQQACSPHCSPYIPYGTCRKNFHKHQDMLSLVIISFILVTCMFDQLVILKGEIGCLSLLSFKG